MLFIKSSYRASLLLAAFVTAMSAACRTEQPSDLAEPAKLGKLGAVVFPTSGSDLALDAARRYAEIAPGAPHALHMPSHIFLQLGMWPEAAASNEASWAASDKWVKQRNLPIGKRDYHSLHWLMYVYLQQGRYGKAEEQLSVMRQSLAAFPKDELRDLVFGTFTHAQMAAAFVTETERWDAAERLFGQQAKTGDAKGQAVNIPDQFEAYVVASQIPAIFTRGMAAATKGSADAQKSMAELRAIRERHGSVSEPFIAQMVRMTEIQELEIGAVYNASRGAFNEAIKITRRAAALEEAMPPPMGPPTVIKPAHELFGEIFLRAKRPKEAAEQCATSLGRHKNRARSLLGAARAAAQSGDTQGAARAYAQFSQQWRRADAQ